MMKKIVAIILCVSVFAIATACSSKSAYDHEKHKMQVKERSEKSAREGMRELDRETK